MKCLIVLSVDLPNPDAVITVLDHIDPQKIPYFDNVIRVIVGQDVEDTVAFLDEGTNRKAE